MIVASERMNIKRIIVILSLVLVLACNTVRSQTPDPVISTLFQNSCQVYNSMRLYGGLYIDAMSLGATDKPAGLAANGVGLISLCIADAMYKKTGDGVNWDPNAESKALQTINEWIRLKNTKGATNVNGLFHRYFNPTDGSWVWVTEHSTIDNAILASGFLFCRNYFHNNTSIVSKTTILLNSMDFTAAIPATGNGMYMILDDNGVGSALTNPFNEYLVLAWFAKNSNPSFAGYNRAQTYWNTNFGNPNTLPQYSYPAGNPTLSGGTTYAQPSFQVQFCYYYCNYFDNNSDYMTFFNNQAMADKAWWLSTTGQQVAWGCGAGEIPGGGYSADAINNNPQKIVSPHIMAGFSPIESTVKADLIALYADGKGSGVYQIPGTSKNFLWRYILSQPALRTSYVQAVDFSSMLYGLAALPEYLGPDFFKTYNDFNYSPTATSSLINSPNGSGLLSNYPNPFSSKTNVQFQLKNTAHVLIEIYSIDGQKVRQLVNSDLIGGKHSVKWDARTEVNTQVQPGTYICRMVIDNQADQTNKLLIVK